MSGDALNSFGTPVGTYVGKYLSCIRNQFSEQHCYAVQRVVFSCHNECFANTVPVERSIQYCFGKVTVWHKVGPLALSLKSSRNGVMSQCFFLKTQITKFRISNHQVAHNDGHFYNKFPFFIKLFARFLFVGFVGIFTFVRFAILLGPFDCFFEFFRIKNVQLYAAVDFTHVDIFIAHAQVFLKEISIDDRTCNSHRNRSDG